MIPGKSPPGEPSRALLWSQTIKGEIMVELSVNVDHVATVREARKGLEPDPVAAAIEAEVAGASGITVHLREDRRHIQDRDLRVLREVIKTALNLEMAATEEMISIAIAIRPDQVTLVPEKRQELTTEGGLDVVSLEGNVQRAISRIQEVGIRVSLFVDPELSQVQAAAKVRANWNSTELSMQPRSRPSLV
jgi:pyridoxine 5-phosphate synthase